MEFASIDKYEVFGAHPEAQFFGLDNAIDFLSGIGIDHIRSRYFRLTSRWMERAQRLPRFRAAVWLDPAHCAGLVGFELAGIERDAVRKRLHKLAPFLRQCVKGGKATAKKWTPEERAGALRYRSPTAAVLFTF